MGGSGVPIDTSPEQLASWVHPEDKVPLVLALSLYKIPRMYLENYILISNPNPRLGIWFDDETGICVVGLKGTSLKGPTTGKDLGDDKIIAGFGAEYCDLTLVAEASRLVEILADQVIGFIFVGHSLGGTAALCLTNKYPYSRGISFNGGGAPINPVLTGPGPRLTHYHIVGDLISSHISPDAAHVVRIKKRDNVFGGGYAHGSERILADDGWWAYATADEEDDAYYKWGTKFGWSSVMLTMSPVAYYAFYLKKKNVVKTNPIPGSTRWYETKKGLTN